MLSRRDELNTMLDLAGQGVSRLLEYQREALAGASASPGSREVPTVVAR